MMSRLGFCCAHAYAQAKAMTIAARRGMLLMNRAIGSLVLVRCRVLLYFITCGPEDGCREKPKILETQRKGGSGGLIKRRNQLFSIPPVTPFLRVSKVLIFCYRALFPTLPEEAALMRLLGSVCLLVIGFSLLPQKALPQSATASPSPSIAQAAPQTQTTEYTLPPDKLAKAKALYDLRGKLRIIDTLYGLLVLLALLQFGVAAKY